MNDDKVHGKQDSVQENSSEYQKMTTPTMDYELDDDELVDFVDSKDIYSNAPEKNEEFLYCSNVVITSKYSVITFVPKFLFETFRQLANMFFLLVSILQCLPKISNTNQIPTNAPVLLFVIGVDAVFAIMEDIRRHRADYASNSAICHILHQETHQVHDHTWSEVKVGDILVIKNREVIPADVLILSVAEQPDVPSSGICYVETKSLDGETNLKLRQAMEATMKVNSHRATAQLDIYIKCETPNPAITKLSGKMKYRDEHHPFSAKNVLLRGCNLRNTEYVYGIVLNTGNDTKIMQSASAAPSKWSGITQSINQMIIGLCVALLFFCTLASSCSIAWEVANEQKTLYLHRPLETPFFQWFINLFYFFLLMYQIVPISLYVSMTTVKFIQSMFMAWDIEMYHQETDTPMIVRTMALNEELGQISYIFTDKTGTLTCNVMDFRKCSINGVLYGTGITEIGRAALIRAGKTPLQDPPADPSKPKIPFVNFSDDRLWDALKGSAGEDTQLKTREFFTHLAVCHTVIPEKLETGEVRLSASSPDEQALVAGAAYFGFKFQSRSVGTVKILIDGEVQEFRILDVLEFNSARKRMSVVVRDPSGNLKLYTKGADVMIYPRCKADTQEARSLLDITTTHMEELADDGLRTLAIAFKPLSDEYYAKWSAKFHDACGNLDELEKRKDDKENQIDQLMDEIETDLEIIGATAIEDKLQKGVPQCLASLSVAGIHIWMLTGDKAETAINIGYACSLLDNSVEQLIINLDSCSSTGALTKKLQDAKASALARRNKREYSNLQGGSSDCALIIDGEALEFALDPSCSGFLLDYLRLCKTVICCRVSPAQKSEMVKLVRVNLKDVKTLAIGDGANDVAMIQAAHIGVGISGQEGLQAVNSSDYAIAQFRFLKRLLLVHGRNNYVRISKLVLYMFYKNIVLVLAQYWYSFVGGVSGQKFYWEFGVQAFNILFTSFPIVLLGIFDRDLPDRCFLLWPELYAPGRLDQFFNYYTFLRWIAAAVFESAVVFLMTVYAYNGFESSTGSASRTEYGMIAFSLSVMITNMKLCLVQSQWTWLSIVGWWFGIISWFLYAYAGTEISWMCKLNASYDECGSFAHAARAPSFWFVMLLGPAVALFRHFTWNQIQRQQFPLLHQILQEKVSLDGEKYIRRKDLPLDMEDEEERNLNEDHEEHQAIIDMDKNYRRSSSFRYSDSSGSKLLTRRNTGFAFSFDHDTTLAESFIASNSFGSPRLAIEASHRQSNIRDSLDYPVV